MQPRIPVTAMALVVLLVASGAHAADRQVDIDAITANIDQWNRGWMSKDPELAASGYSADADWTNAFGFYNRGKAEIEAFLDEVFQLPFVMAADSRVVDQSIRFFSDEVAAVRTLIERVGQTTPDGQPLGARHTHHLRIFQKHDGRWVIVSHLISDARDLRAPEH